MIRQISVFLENRAGQLSEITGILAAGGVDLRAINIAEASDYGVLRMLCDDARLAANLLSERNFIVSVTPVVAVQVPDVPGGLDTVLRAINAAGIDIGYMYSSFGKTDGDAFMIFRVSDPDALAEALTAAGIPPAAPDALGVRV
jgi:hypothetical protein